MDSGEIDKISFNTYGESSVCLRVMCAHALIYSYTVAKLIWIYSIKRRLLYKF